MVILALGKFGGREMNYHSDLDIIFLYEADGQTVAAPDRPAGKPPRTSISSANWASGSSRPPAGQALRPAVRGRCPASPHRPERRVGHQFRRVRPLLRRRRRATLGAAGAVQGAGGLRLAAGWPRPRWPSWPKPPSPILGGASDAAEIRQMRQRLEDTAAAAGDLKRGPGGIVDIEFLVQMLQLKHAGGNPRLRAANTLAALGRVAQGGPARGRRFRVLRPQLSAVADDRGPACG